MSKNRILVVDDDKALATITSKMLSRENYQVDVVNGYQDALSKATEGVYELIILDVMMPGMTGLEVCEILRDKGCEVPILFLTAKTGSLDVLKGYSAGGTDYLCKPYERSELLSKVASLLGESDED